MKNQRLILQAIVLFAVLSCNSHKPDIKTMADKFAALECRAMTLREQRFGLANQLRFTQDTLLHAANKADTTRLKLKLEAFNKEKNITLKQSLLLADSIHNEINDLMQNQLTNKKDKETFNQMLNDVLQQRGCLKK